MFTSKLTCIHVEGCFSDKPVIMKNYNMNDLQWNLLYDTHYQQVVTVVILTDIGDNNDYNALVEIK